MKSLAERFESKTIPEPNSGCLLWLGNVSSPSGYARMTINGKPRVASHIALELAGRPLPQGMYACHHCDNPGCVNVDHLFFGTQKDNIADAIKKGRLNFGNLRHARERKQISEDQRQPAREMFNNGFGIIATSRATGINRSNVQNWFRKWGHIPRTYKRRNIDELARS